MMYKVETSIHYNSQCHKDVKENSAYFDTLEEAKSFWIRLKFNHPGACKYECTINRVICTQLYTESITSE